MSSDSQAKRLPTTSYAILGLLSFGESSGYDLKRFADVSIRYFFWSPASSQVYSELRRLTALGYVTERNVAQERRPDKRIYRITQEGEQALRDWLSDPAVDQDTVKSTPLLKLFFGKHADWDTLVAQLEEYKRQSEELLSQFEGIEKDISNNDDLFFPYLTLKSGFAHAHARIQWANEALEEIKKRRSKQS